MTLLTNFHGESDAGSAAICAQRSSSFPKYKDVFRFQVCSRFCGTLDFGGGAAIFDLKSVPSRNSFQHTPDLHRYQVYLHYVDIYPAKEPDSSGPNNSVKISPPGTCKAPISALSKARLRSVESICCTSDAACAASKRRRRSLSQISCRASAKHRSPHKYPTSGLSRCAGEWREMGKHFSSGS